MDELELLSENKEVKQETVLNSAEHTAYRGAVGSLLWASSTTRPDLAFDVALLSGATSSPTMRDLVLANNTVKRAKRAHVTLHYPRLRGPLLLEISACMVDALYVVRYAIWDFVLGLLGNQ